MTDFTATKLTAKLHSKSNLFADLEHQSRQLVNLSSEHEAMIKRQGELKEELITKEKLYADAAQQV